MAQRQTVWGIIGNRNTAASYQLMSVEKVDAWNCRHRDLTKNIKVSKGNQNRLNHSLGPQPLGWNTSCQCLSWKHEWFFCVDVQVCKTRRIWSVWCQQNSQLQQCKELFECFAVIIVCLQVVHKRKVGRSLPKLKLSRKKWLMPYSFHRFSTIGTAMNGSQDVPQICFSADTLLSGIRTCSPLPELTVREMRPTLMLTDSYSCGMK